MHIIINRRIECFNLRKPKNSGKYQSSLLWQDEMDALCSNCLQVFLRGFPTVWAASQKFIDFGICSPVKGENGSVWAWNMRVAWERAKATPFGFCLEHCLRQLRNSSPKIYSCYDRQLYSRLQISHKIETREAITRIYKFGKISRVVGGSLFLVEYWQSEATFCGRRRRDQP